MELIDKLQDVIDEINKEYGYRVYYRYGDLLEVEYITEQLNIIMSTQDQKYPFIYINTDYDQEEIIENKAYETDLHVYIIDRADESKNAEYRHENEMAELRTYETMLKSKMKSGGFNWENPKRKQLFFNKDQKLFETPINAIRLHFQGLQYELKSNC